MTRIIRQILVALMLCASGWGCGNLDSQPGDLRAIKDQAAAERLLSSILRACAIPDGTSVCRSDMLDRCNAVVKVDGARYRCPVSYR